MRRSSELRLLWRSSSVSVKGWLSSPRVGRLLMLPLALGASLWPVELERRPRVFLGERGGATAGDVSKLALRWSNWVPLLMILGMVRLFSSVVEEGEAERGASAKVIEMERLGGAGLGVVGVIRQAALEAE